MNAATTLKEYVEIPMKELVESSTNPRKSFDEAALDELAGSIRSKGVLSPRGKVQLGTNSVPAMPRSYCTTLRKTIMKQAILKKAP